MNRSEVSNGIVSPPITPTTPTTTIDSRFECNILTFCPKILYNNLKEWAVKFYEQQQRTYIVLCDDANIGSDDENPILRATKKCKSKYKRGQLVVEWKQQKNIDFNGNLTQAGHIYFHFFNSQAMIQ
ncbi:unnamed protein product [Rhizophagus irregularis]|nr:unnamed protein product [Rhizophagus irregularis]CAB5179337.1 unnamed protein product [Rhizophagus irregularis]CAB5192900.1 unnamed protein product [Rhizophagus irregularis]